MFELSKSTKALCELSCRTEPLVSDVSLALIEMGTIKYHWIDICMHHVYWVFLGQDISLLQPYARRSNRKLLPPSKYLQMSCDHGLLLFV